MIKAIVIDDEPTALDIIKNHAEKVTYIQLLATFVSAVEALTYIQQNPVDLIFLDIHMPDLSGLEFASMIKRHQQVIFTTAYPEHALKGFDLAATDYLLKPINFNRFLQACLLAESRYNSSFTKARQSENLFVKDGNNWIRIKLNELLYVRGEDNYINLVEKNKRTLVRMTLKELQKKLPLEQFLRIHKSYIISISKIEKIEKQQVTIAGTQIPLSMLSVDALLQKVDELG
ncbi:LytTR family DNA-binding domain-containing protein [Sphingobacterium sp. HMA12]|uniref:LytR/AlgR family response regulator transcription factor n=1 Tax=Sphingobacterium sp. HMA12 TaxID=2050894 RepID=UPI000CEA0710|nr:response regulator transcription factor [Sphingobacterium sp. HMA12]